ncbi:MAG TPA: DUF1223 domain-containing protein [Casimicrobiaceae bacterium]
MKWPAFLFCTTAACAPLAMPTMAVAGCDAQSASVTAALVELYTSEGCSSCPPADARLSHLDRALEAGAKAIPLALHVGYWDYLGWNDPFAQDAFARRQEWLVHVNHHATVYTPHFFVGGTEIDLAPAALPEAVQKVNATRAAANIRVQARIGADAQLVVDADATTAARARPAALYVAVTENGLTSQVARGENGGATLHEDHVVRAWLGPFDLSAGAVHAQRTLALPAGWKRDQLDVVAFVEDPQTGAVLQAVSAASCARA